MFPLFKNIKLKSLSAGNMHFIFTKILQNHSVFKIPTPSALCMKSQMEVKIKELERTLQPM
jgi:hypothetical protein